MTVLIPRDRRYSRYLFDLSARFCLERNSLAAITGQAGTLARTSIGTAISGAGVVVPCAHSQQRITWIDLDGDGVRETPAFLLEDATTNLCLQSENFGTTWAAVGTPTRTAAAHTASGVTLDLIGDDDASAAEGYSQNITFTGNAIKAISIVVKQGTSTSTVIRLRDTTASADRAIAVVTWSAGLPVVTMTGGVSLGFDRLNDGAFRIWVQTTSVTAANTNQLTVYPATTSGFATANTGNVYAGGVQVENAIFPSSYLKTTTGTVARVADAFTFPLLVPPRALTVYLDAIWYVATNAATNFVGFSIGTSTPAYLIGRLEGANPVVSTQHNPGAGAVTSSTATPVGYAHRAETRHILNADGSVIAGASIDGGNESVAAASAAAPFTASAWSSAVLTLGNDAGQRGFLAIRAIRIAAGVQSLAYMREG